MSSTPTVPVSAGSYTISIADSDEQVAAAQQLRYDVFAGDLGAQLHATTPGLDADDFDELCDHLIVQHEPTGDVVGTYRLLPPGRGGRLYSETEFDLGGVARLRPELVEAGRSCVHPAHRGGSVINLMWSGLARYALLGGYRYLAGCASVPLDDGGRAAHDTWQLAERKHISPAELQVRPFRPWRSNEDSPRRPSYATLPPLLRGYLRLGAWVCGPPAHDPDFGVADFFVLLPLAELDQRYLRFFLGTSTAYGSRETGARR